MSLAQHHRYLTPKFSTLPPVFILALDLERGYLALPTVLYPNVSDMQAFPDSFVKRLQEGA